jgi:transposase-like protein
LIPAILAYRANGVSINRTAQLVGVSRGTVRRVSTESPLGLTVSVSSNS